MTLLVPWLVFPLVLGVLTLGCGLFATRLAGSEVPHVLLLPLGFAVIVVVGVATTSNSATARLTVPVVIGLAAAGLGLAFPWRLRPVDGWALAAGAGVYAAFGAPVFMSGSATFAGYITLDDTSTWLGFTDRLLTHGRTLTGLAPSTYQAALDWYWNQNGYPVGAYPPLGIGHVLVGTDSAWLVQPYISFTAGLLALGLYGLVQGLLPSPRLRALVAFIAAQPAVLYGYAIWGGIKEVPAAALLAAVAALAPVALRTQASARSLLPLAAATSAVVAILNFSSGVWLVPLLLPVLVIGFRLRGRPFGRLAVAFAATVVALSAPSLVVATGFLRDTSTLLTKETELGNLVHPLSWLQLFGIWPVGDFRFRPGQMGPVYVLIAVLVAAGTVGLAWAARHRRWELPLYVGGAVVGCAIAIAVGSPWIGAKALAISSPALVLAGMTGAAWLFGSRRRIEAAVVAAAIAGGVLWSNALAYHDVWLAPRGQLRELEQIGKVFAGSGPTLTTEYQPYAVRHFLRDMDPEAPSELRRRAIPLRSGRLLPKGEYRDVDDFQLDAILVYRTLVLPHSPSASRPPSVYRLVWSGRFYDVWQRPRAQGARIVDHLSLQQGDQPAAMPPCRAIGQLARVAAKDGGELAAVVRPAATVVRLATASLPPGWRPASGTLAAVYPQSSGMLETSFFVSRRGRYGTWLEGTFRRSLEVSVDGRRMYRGRGELMHEGIETLLGYVQLEPGRHQIGLRYGGADLRPGSGGPASSFGPIVVSRYTDETGVRYVNPTDARSLCGKRLDWVEVVRR
jgi:hypothetical protein